MAQQTQDLQQQQPLQEQEQEEEVRWQQELLRRLRAIHRSETDEDTRTGVDRWRERLPPQTTSAFPSSLRRSSYGSGSYRPYASPEADVEGWRAAVYNDEAQPEDAGELSTSSLSGSAVAYEPWRTTVATGTRYAHRPPPHPYSVLAPSTQSPLTDNSNSNSYYNNYNDASCEGAYATGAERWRTATRPQSPLPPPPSAASPSSSIPLLRVPHRPNSCPALYIDSANSSQISPPDNYVPGYVTAATTTTTATTSSPATASPGGGGAGPQALYLSGRRRSRLPSTPLPWTPSPPRSQHLANTSATAQIARLHENHLHDQYARAAWNAVVAQTHAQERERERLSSPSQSAQVQRLYTEPLQDRMNRAAAHARPSAEQLYRFHGCTFTPKINDSRLTQRGGAAGGRFRGTPSGTRNSPARGANTSSESVRVPSTLPSNNTTMTCDDTTSAPANTQSSAYRRGRRVTPS